jgi:hypothetical protein
MSESEQVNSLSDNIESVLFNSFSFKEGHYFGQYNNPKSQSGTVLP